MSFTSWVGKSWKRITSIRVCFNKGFQRRALCGPQPSENSNVNGSLFPSVKKAGNNNFRNIQILLFGTSCALVVGTVFFGGLTRRKRAGLSMTTWSFFPEKWPSTNEEFELLFESYKKLPEYKASDQDMNLDEFKFIFFLEWFHRAFSRITGATVLVSAATLLFTKIPADKVRFVIYSSLIIGQGLMGWYMVKSGFDEKTVSSPVYGTVSQYRLAAHFSLAAILFSLLIHRTMNFLPITKRFVVKSLRGLKFASILSHTTVLACFITMVSGSFVAGSHAGLVHNTWPLMGNDKYIPDDMWTMEPCWKNLFENQATVQFIHRNLAYLTTAMIIANSLCVPLAFSSSPISLKMAAIGSLLSTLLQVHLGITTLRECRDELASQHQVNSFFMLASLIIMQATLSRVKKVL